jgi:centromere protein C
MDQDDDDDEGEGGQGGHDEEQQEEDRQTPLPPLRRNKGKERAVLPDVPEEDEDLEDEIAQGLQHVELQHYDDDDGGREEEDRTEPEKRRNKKAKLANEETRKPSRPRGKSKKENRGKSLLLRSTSILPILA